MELQLTTCTGQARHYRKGGAKQSWAIIIGRGLARSGAKWKGRWLVSLKTGIEGDFYSRKSRVASRLEFECGCMLHPHTCILNLYSV